MDMMMTHKMYSTPGYMLPPDGYIYMYMPQVFKNILHFLLCHIFGLNNSYHDLWSDPLKKHEEYSDQSAINSCS